MNRWETGAVLLVLLGAAGIALPSVGVIDVGGGATYYLETEPVDTNAVPESADVDRLETLPDATSDAVRESVARVDSPVELGSRRPEATPEYVRYENATYRIDVWHVDHAPNPFGFVSYIGGWALVTVGCLGVLVSLVKRWTRERS